MNHLPSIPSFLVLALLCLGLSSCRHSQTAAEAAETCYALLIEGDAEGFVDHIASAPEMSPEYRSQMVDAVAQFLQQIQRQNGGIVAAQAVNVGEEDSLTQVTLQLTFGDGTQEVVGLPMVRTTDTWLMR